MKMTHISHSHRLRTQGEPKTTLILLHNFVNA